MKQIERAVRNQLICDRFGDRIALQAIADEFHLKISTIQYILVQSRSIRTRPPFNTAYDAARDALSKEIAAGRAEITEGLARIRAQRGQA